MEAIKVTLVYCLCLLLPFAITGMWWWFGMFVVMGVTLGLFEYVSVRKQKKTLSRKYWDSQNKNKLLVVLGIGLFSLYLILHLMFGI